ncbi:MAG: 2-C-methyl-D-erythritol 2,4-cyclodiphosphate synthase [Cyanobacteria bacterium NC_groundwater_1444_Ag_S-0.65um_54_12]|nr:2-C-methyl-D-erythritol 2,4-cyclodiphosphate synthase [Cyanobacteria bacterium NC_groundwater_1444_Ag_S-0.65um_54_12]
MTTVRIGTGFDLHALVADRPLILGGITIPHERGLAGDSDADVLTHALMDALLGALALGDLGSYFPPGDPRFRGACSLDLLRQVRYLVRKNGWRVGNIDATIIAQEPRLGPHISVMRQSLASALEVNLATVSVKATSTDQLGTLGRREGIAAQAVVLLER